MQVHYDIAIVGGGILGLAHAFLASRRGKRVVLFERDRKAVGASVRNFGMIWPIGQPAGEMHQMALRSRELWADALDAAKLPSQRTGSLHVANEKDESDLLCEFAEIGPQKGYSCTYLTPSQVLERSPAIKAQHLRGGLWSDTELTVDPRQIVAGFAEYLESQGVEIRFGEPVHAVVTGQLESVRGINRAERIIICSGLDFQTLLPQEFAKSGMTRCKLQMMRTEPQPNEWKLGPSLAAGLTLRFYKAFQICKSLEVLKRRIREEKPQYDHWAIHVLASQTADGAITLGDSHEYGDNIEVFDRTEIDHLILQEASTFFDLPSWKIAERWHGLYALHPERPFFEANPLPGVHILTGVGGSGMTLSFGLAERTLKSWASEW